MPGFVVVERYQFVTKDVKPTRFTKLSCRQTRLKNRRPYMAQAASRFPGQIDHVWLERHI